MTGQARDGGGIVSIGRDPAFVAIGETGERRQHARAVARWTKARGTARLPQLGDGAAGSLEGDSAVALFEISDAGVRLIEIDPRLDREPEWADPLLDQIISRISAVRLQLAPIGFEAEGWNGRAAMAIRGVLLPFADQSGALRYVETIVSWKAILPTAEAPIAVLTQVEAMGAADAPARGSRFGDGSPEERLAVARTWAALAAADPLSRGVSINAALSAVFDAVLLGGRMPQPELIDATFLTACSSSERRKLRLALRHATRLGLGAGELAGVLARYPGGAGAMARLELAILKQERIAANRIEPAEAGTVRLRLVPIAPDPQAPRAREDRALAEETPWHSLATIAA